MKWGQGCAGIKRAPVVLDLDVNTVQEPPKKSSRKLKNQVKKRTGEGEEDTFVGEGITLLCLR
jgi:hypothetical protein